MSQVLITQSKLDTLAQTINTKTGATLPLTLDDMNSAIRDMSSGGFTPTGEIEISENDNYNVANYATTNVAIPFNKICFNKNSITPKEGDVYIDITSQEVVATSIQSMSFIPNGYLDDYQWTDATTQNISSFYADTSSTSYARISMKTGAGSETYGYFTFDLSNKPSENYYLTSVSCKIALSNTATSNERSEAWVALCLNKEVISATKTNLTGTSKVTLTLPAATLTTWEDLSNLTLKVYGTRGNSNVTYARYFYLYGADLTINYTTVPEYKTTITTERYNGTSWEPVEFDNALMNNINFTIN